jgi:hypothetical protein
VAALLSGIAGCGTSQQTEDGYIAFCAAQGLDPGSEMFIDCVQSQRLRNTIETQRIRDMRSLRPSDR